MKRTDEGSLTIEAVLALTIFLFFMMFMANFGHIYRVQNFMAHSLAQSGQMLSFSSYAYSFGDLSGSDLLQTINTLAKDLALYIGVPLDGIEMQNAWTGENYPDAARYAFKYCAGTSKSILDNLLEMFGAGSPMEQYSTDALMKKYKIESLNFDGTGLINDDKDLCIKATYKIHLPFAFFGIDSAEMHQQIVCKIWACD